MTMVTTDHRRLVCVTVWALFLAGLSPGAAQMKPRPTAESTGPISAQAALQAASVPIEAAENSQEQAQKSTAPSHPTAMQISSGFSVSGSVFDPSGAIVAGAKVTLHGGADRREESTTTNASGEFRFDGISAGDYELQLEHPGFKTYKSRLKVSRRTLTPLRIVLDIAELKETITVDSSERGVKIDIAGNADSFKLDPQLLEALPILDQDVI